MGRGRRGARATCPCSSGQATVAGGLHCTCHICQLPVIPAHQAGMRGPLCEMHLRSRLCCVSCFLTQMGLGGGGGREEGGGACPGAAVSA